MAKHHITYVCRECGEDYRQWQGQCRNCHAWNTLVQVRLDKTNTNLHAANKHGIEASTLLAQPINAIDPQNITRITTFADECNRVLGGGIAPGSTILIGGAPGAGKSTLLMQMLCHIAKHHQVVYVSGEESVQQLALRASRLGFGNSTAPLLVENDVDAILAYAREHQPKVMVVDSIQTLYSETTTGSPGGVSQVRECAMRLVQFARENNCATILIGHVTKEGALAGPRVLEHLVDCSISMESSSDMRLRTLRAHKNRYGAVNEIGIFAMLEQGLREVKNPSSLFLSGSDVHHSGTMVTVIWEGSRPLLIEIQTLLDQNKSNTPARRVTLGMDYNRLLLLLAVMHKHAHINCFDQDVFASLVGGMRVQETSVDIALALAMCSSLTNKAIDRQLIAFAEVGLTGELRPVPYGQERLREAAKHGFTRAIVAKANAPRKDIGIQVIPVATLAEAIQATNVNKEL